MTVNMIVYRGDQQKCWLIRAEMSHRLVDHYGLIDQLRKDCATIKMKKPSL